MKPVALLGTACVCFSAFITAYSAPETFRADETEAEKDSRMQWWREAKFGMFVHWGIYAGAEGQWQGETYPDMRPGIEWLMCKGGLGPGGGGIPKSDYVNELAPKMSLEQFDPEAWAALAKEAGMRYFVITAKHHDGFGMVDFPDTDYDIVGQTPFGRDPMLGLAAAMRKAGLRFGFYFSQSQDWSKPGGRPHWFKGLEGDWTDYAKSHAAPQLRHLLGGAYGAIDLLWFDSGSMTQSREGAEAIWAEFATQPDIIVNNRLKQGFEGDFDTPEQWIPATIQDEIDWETCMTMNGSWGYNPTDPHWKSPEEMIRKLCAVVGRGGNFLLNVGPRADGSWEPQVGEILRGIGAWMEANGEAIYGTEANPIGAQRWGEMTWKSESDINRLYVMVFDWPSSQSILLPLKNDPVSLGWLSSSGSQPQWKREEDGIRIDLNRATPVDAAVSVIEIALDGEPEAMPVVVQPLDSGVFELSANEARTSGEVRMHWRTPMLWGFSGKRASEGRAEWDLRVNQPGEYNIVVEYAYNHPDPKHVEGQAFVVSIAGVKHHFQLQLTGLEPDSHNKERNVLKPLAITADEGIQLGTGKHTLAVTSTGAPTENEKFSRNDLKNYRYDSFAYLKSVHLVPVK